VAISATRGALGPICFGDQYVPVPDWIIADLQAREDGSGAVPLVESQKKGLTPGAAVAVQLDDDTFAQGLFYSFSGQENVVVLLVAPSNPTVSLFPLSFAVGQVPGSVQSHGSCVSSRSSAWRMGRAFCRKFFLRGA
jgi:transcriptional antiterminator RfaH